MYIIALFTNMTISRNSCIHFIIIYVSIQYWHCQFIEKECLSCIRVGGVSNLASAYCDMVINGYLNIIQMKQKHIIT